MKTVLSLALLLSASAYADIPTGKYYGRTNEGKSCSLEIIHVSKPVIIDFGHHNIGRNRVYKITAKTSLLKHEKFVAQLALSCYNDDCSEFSTDLRQVAKDNEAPINETKIFFSSDRLNRGGSYPSSGREMPNYLPESVSTHSKNCNLEESSD